MSIINTPDSSKIQENILATKTQDAESDVIHTDHLTLRESMGREEAMKAMHDFKNLLTSGELLEELLLQMKETHTVSRELSEKILATALKTNVITALTLKFERSTADPEDSEISYNGRLENINKEHAEFSKEVRMCLVELDNEISHQGLDSSLSRSIKTINSTLDDAQSFVDSVMLGKFAYSEESLKSTKVPLHTTIRTASLAFEKGKKTILSSLKKRREDLSASLIVEETDRNKIEQELQQIDEYLDAIPKKKLFTPLIDTHLKSNFTSPQRKTTPTSKALGTEISRIISNTLSNAVKYGGKNTQFNAGWIFSQSSERAGYLILTFKDDGNGIDLDPELTKDKLPEQIDEFAKNKLFPSEPTKKESNTGCGFGGFNVHQIMDDLGGKISVKTKGGTIENGSEITFRIPLTIKPIETRSAKQAETAPDAHELVPIDDMAFPSTDLTEDALEELRESGLQVIILEDNPINMRIAVGHVSKTLEIPSPVTKEKIVKKRILRRPVAQHEKAVKVKGRETLPLYSEQLPKGPKPVTFNSGQDAMKPGQGSPYKILDAIEHAICQKRPVVLLLDNSVGDDRWNGHGISREIHSWCSEQAAINPDRAEAYEKVRIYSYTADSAMTKSEKALYDGCLTKPVTGNSIANALLAAIQNSRMHNEHL